MNYLYESPVQFACYDNSLDVFTPEMMAREVLEQLVENMVMADLVHRNYSAAIAKEGDLVKIEKPGEFKTKRRTDSTVASTLIQNATATDVTVPLDQRFNVSFTIKYGEGATAWDNLVERYIQPASVQMARGIDRMLLGRAAHAFLSTPSKRAGRLSGLTSATAYTAVTELDKIMNVNKAPPEGRVLILAPDAKETMLNCDKFSKANERGDNGQVISTARLGSVLGFNTYLAQNVNSVLTGADFASETVTDPYAAESHVAQSCSTISTLVVNGEFCVVEGNDQPTYITAHVDSTSFTLNEANKYATLDNATAKRYKACQVNTSAAIGWSEGIVLKSYTTGKAPQVGQLIAFDADGSHRHTYTVIESEDAGSTCTVTLDRPLVHAITANDYVFPGPYGSLNIALQRNALALVTRPLNMPGGAGMFTATVEAYGLAVTLCMQDVINVGRTVSIELLAGCAVLDEDRAAVLLS